MIFTERTITISKGESQIDEPIVLYRGDYEVEIRFTILNTKLKYQSGINLINSEKPFYGQMVISRPIGDDVFFDITKCSEGIISVVITKDMLDELDEVGIFSFQIRLYDYGQRSRFSIPPVNRGLEIRNPIASEDCLNVVDEGLVDYAVVKSTKAELITAEDPFDEDGLYNPTVWSSGDSLTVEKLNKIEAAIYEINENEMNDVKNLTTQMNSNYNVLLSMIETLQTIVESLKK